MSFCNINISYQKQKECEIPEKNIKCSSFKFFNAGKLQKQPFLQKISHKELLTKGFILEQALEVLNIVFWFIDSKNGGGNPF